MLKINAYLNFNGTCAEAFEFYKSVFGTEFNYIGRMGEMPQMGEASAEEKDLVMHVSLPINEYYTLMGSDVVPSFNQTLVPGNHIYVSLHPESREEADRLFNGLSAGGKVEMPMADQFWGSYFGCFVDKYGIGWMINQDAMTQGEF